MSDDNLANQAKRIAVGRYPSWIKKFDVNEYMLNRPMIEKLHEEKQFALATNIDLEQRVNSLTSQVHELDLINERLSGKLDEFRRQSFIVFALSLVAAILVGIGVNIVTDNPYTWVGWVLIVASVVIELIIFLTVVYHRE